MRFLHNISFMLFAMMVTAAGYSCRVQKLTTNWRSVVLCIIVLMHTIKCNDSSCLNQDCDGDEVKLLIHEKRLYLQRREYELIQKQKELQRQLQKLYSEQHQLESEVNDEPKVESEYSGLEYEIPSYCANCLGDAFEPSSKSTLSSEYSRKTPDGLSVASQQEDVQTPQLSDHGRLEAIKFQILLKLGLKNKPNVTNSISKQFIFDALQRSGETKINDYTMLFQSSDNMEMHDLVSDQLQQMKTSNQSKNEDILSEELKEAQPEDDHEFDDFYGRTREIISFAEKGQQLNGHHLLEFTNSIDNQTSLSVSKLKIRLATLWVMIRMTPSEMNHASNDIVQLHQLSHNHKINVNESLMKFKNQSQRKRRKRKRKDNDAHSFENHSYNHITKAKNDGNHIIKSSRNEKKRRKVKSINLVDKLNSTSSTNDEIRQARNLTLWIFRINQTLTEQNNSVEDKEFDKLSELTASKIINIKSVGWQKIDVTSLVQKWYQEESNEKRLQIFVECSGCGDKFRAHFFPPITRDSLDNKKQSSKHQPINDDRNRPFLVVHIEPNVVKRNRRRALDCSVATKTECCKQRFYVSFKALGWDDWIIAPPGYYANYCSGSCGGGLNRTPDTFLTYYSHVFHEVRKYNKLNGNQLCCAPLKFSSMSLIYFGPDSKIIKRDLPKMVVDECGCP